MDMTISGKVVAALVIQLVFSIALPIAALLVWKAINKLKLRSFLMGFVAFLVFALLGQQALHMLVLDMNPTLGGFIESRPWLNALYVGLTAGFFEETARLLMFKTALRDDPEREHAVAYGIGHGGFECIVALGLMAISNLVITFAINSGRLTETILTMTEEEKQAILATVDMINGANLSAALLTILERICMMVLHVALSVFVFTALHKKKMWLYPVAVLAHAGVEMVSALHEAGFAQLWLIEIVLVLYVLVVSIPALRMYRSLPSLKVEQVDRFGRPIQKKK